MTATAVEPAAPPESAAPEPDVLIGVSLPGGIEERIRRLAAQTQAGIPAIVASWLSAAGEDGVDAPVPATSSAGMSIAVPAHIARAVRAEAQRRGLQVGQVAAARLASVASRGS